MYVAQMLADIIFKAFVRMTDKIYFSFKKIKMNGMEIFLFAPISVGGVKEVTSQVFKLSWLDARATRF